MHSAARSLHNRTRSVKRNWLCRQQTFGKSVIPACHKQQRLPCLWIAQVLRLAAYLRRLLGQTIKCDGGETTDEGSSLPTLQSSSSSQAICGRFWNQSQSDIDSSTTQLDESLPPYWSTTGPTSSRWEDLDWFEAPAPASWSFMTPSPTFLVRAVSAIPETVAHVSALFAEPKHKQLEREPEEQQPSFEMWLECVRERPHLISDLSDFVNSELCPTAMPEVDPAVHNDRMLRAFLRHHSIML